MPPFCFPYGLTTLATTDLYVSRIQDEKRLIGIIEATERPYRVRISKGSTRSIEQNAYLWGVCYETLLGEGGLRDMGWRNEDLHEYFLGEYFGWEELDGMGRKRVRPLRRSSKLRVMEFADFIGFIQERAAQMGVVIPDPECS